MDQKLLDLLVQRERVVVHQLVEMQSHAHRLRKELKLLQRFLNHANKPNGRGT
jgi:hypothetical protein